MLCFLFLATRDDFVLGEDMLHVLFCVDICIVDYI